MKISIKSTNFELTPAIRQYVEMKISSLEKFSDNIIQAFVEVELISYHHNRGKIYRAEVQLKMPGKSIRVEKTESDLYKAIDKVKDHIRQEIVEKKKKKKDITMRKYGKVRRFMKSIWPWR